MSVARLGGLDERVTLALAAAGQRGGRVTRAALCQALALPLVRLNGLLVALARLLNVDGQPVIEVDDGSDTVVLNVELLKLQFGL